MYIVRTINFNPHSYIFTYDDNSMSDDYISNLYFANRTKRTRAAQSIHYKSANTVNGM